MNSGNTTERRLELAIRHGYLLIPKDPNEKRRLDYRLTRGIVCMPFPGAYALVESFNKLDPRVQARMTLKAAHALHPGWTFCLFSAAVAHGLQVPQELLSRTHVAISPSESRRKHPGQVTCHIDKGGGHVLADNIPCTTLMQTTLDCLCASTFRQGLAIVDSVLHHRLATKEQLIEYFAMYGKGRRGIKQARETLKYADGRSENGGESIVRAVIIELGFETPELQIEIEDPMMPGVSKRADLGWKLSDGRYILAELDGFAKYLTKGARHSKVEKTELAVQSMRAERLRESHLNLTGAVILRFSFAQALDTSYFFQLLATAGVPLAGERTL